MGGPGSASSSTAGGAPGGVDTIASFGIMSCQVEALENSAIGAAFEGVECAAAQPKAGSVISGTGAQEAVDAIVRVLLLLRLMKWRASRLFLHYAGVNLQSCFESECKRFYHNRISAWNTAVKFITPMFFYIFVIFIALSVVQENWYVHEGMCWGRCLNGSDYWADQNLGMPWADNSLGHWLHPQELQARGIPTGPPVCPGTGTVAVNPENCQRCAWVDSLFKTTVLPPIMVGLSENTTLCQAEVLVVNMSAAGHNLTPTTGTPIPAMWQSMYQGRNEDNSTQVGTQSVAVTNDTGYAVFSSPAAKPFNASSGYGCNFTVLAANITGFSVHPSALLSNWLNWTNCNGSWVETSPCNATCKFNGTRTCTYQITTQNNTWGKPCPAREGQNKTLSCVVKPNACNCEGEVGREQGLRCTLWVLWQ